jgi:hypothetical protein
MLRSTSNQARTKVRRLNAAQSAANHWRRWRVARGRVMGVPSSSTLGASGNRDLKVSQWCLRPRKVEALGHRSAGAGLQESSGGIEPSGFQLGGLGQSVSPFNVALPNPSLERTSTGLALGPRTGQCHHPSRGPSANPVASAQLKR